MPISTEPEEDTNSLDIKVATDPDVPDAVLSNDIFPLYCVTLDA